MQPVVQNCIYRIPTPSEGDYCLLPLMAPVTLIKISKQCSTPPGFHSHMLIMKMWAMVMRMLTLLTVIPRLMVLIVVRGCANAVQAVVRYRASVRRQISRVRMIGRLHGFRAAKKTILARYCRRPVCAGRMPGVKLSHPLFTIPRYRTPLQYTVSGFNFPVVEGICCE